MNKSLLGGHRARRGRSGFRCLGILSFLALLALPVRAAPLQRDLGAGLLYFRLHAVPADLPSDEALQKHAAVIDLRYTKSDAGAATVLAGWLKFHANAHTPLFVLVNRGTAPALIAALEDHDSLAGVLTIGSSGQKPEPDLTVATTAEDERRAYDALEAGTPFTTLTTDNPGKPRNDEASLAHDRAPEPTDAGDATTESDAPSSGAKARPLSDAALQRAIQVYRGLKAMKVA